MRPCPPRALCATQPAGGSGSTRQHASKLSAAPHFLAKKYCHACPAVVVVQAYSTDERAQELIFAFQVGMSRLVCRMSSREKIVPNSPCQNCVCCWLVDRTSEKILRSCDIKIRRVDSRWKLKRCSDFRDFQVWRIDDRRSRNDWWFSGSKVLAVSKFEYFIKLRLARLGSPKKINWAAEPVKFNLQS